jgi:hypothetical protein
MNLFIALTIVLAPLTLGALCSTWWPPGSRAGRRRMLGVILVSGAAFLSGILAGGGL